jgi:hypothetical protein
MSGPSVLPVDDIDGSIVYDTKTGALYNDAKDSGPDAAAQIALLGASTHTTLLYTDLQIIA